MQVADQRSHRSPVPALFCHSFAKNPCHRQVLVQGCQRIFAFPSSTGEGPPCRWSKLRSAPIIARHAFQLAGRALPACSLLAALRQTCLSRSSEHVWWKDRRIIPRGGHQLQHLGPPEGRSERHSPAGLCRACLVSVWPVDKAVGRSRYDLVAPSTVYETATKSIQTAKCK